MDKPKTSYLSLFSYLYEKNTDHKREMLLDLLDVVILKIRNNDPKSDIIELLKSIERLI